MIASLLRAYRSNCVGLLSPRTLISGVASWSAVAVFATSGFAQDPKTALQPTPLEMVLAETMPLAISQGDRPPLVLWTPDFPATGDDAELEKTLGELKSRGIALLHRWGPDIEKSAAAALRIGRLQKKLGMPVCIDGTGIAHGFFNGKPETAFVDAEGNRYFDKSFFWNPGCPFTLEQRYPERRQIVEAFVAKYRDAGVPIDYWMADWEFDGPHEWNDSWAAAKKCVITRAKIKNIDTDFLAYQSAVRAIRAEMQREVFVKPILAAFPKARVGNYAVHPHDGRRYWWDFFEKVTPGLPATQEYNALYRPWANEFTPSGYTLAMPVIYTWYPTHDYYPFANKQYRWFYNMLLEVTSVAKSTPPGTPVLPFVHWTTTNPPPQLPAGFEPLSEANYEELLWHMLLRGFDSFCMWSPANETAAEVKPVHRVYAASLEYREFLDRGVPLAMEVPKEPGTVISALRLDKRLLVRRTDFTDVPGSVAITVEGRKVEIPRRLGSCFVMKIEE